MVPQEGKQELSAVSQRPQALRDLEGEQTKGNDKTFLMAILNSEREPYGSMPQMLLHVQCPRDLCVPGDSPGESQAIVHKDSGLSRLEELNSQDHLSTTS